MFLSRIERKTIFNVCDLSVSGKSHHYWIFWQLQSLSITTTDFHLKNMTFLRRLKPCQHCRCNKQNSLDYIMSIVEFAKFTELVNI